MTWNVLAPELLQYFWRSSYGLPLLASSAEYEAVTASRLHNVAAHVKHVSPDVLLLQETSDTRFACLGDRTTAEYLAHETGMVVASSSAKHLPFTYGQPPYEQAGRGRPTSRSMDSGVTTLYTPSRVSHLSAVCTAESSCGLSEGRPPASSVFPRGGVGSPFTLDAFSGIGEGGAPPFLVLNTHVRMEYPRIGASLGEAMSRAGVCVAGLLTSGQGSAVVSAIISAGRLIVAGDLNAGTAEAADDLRAALAAPGVREERRGPEWAGCLHTLLPHGGLVDVPFHAGSGGEGGGGVDDHVIIGPGISILRICSFTTLPLLAMKAQPPSVPVSDAALWGRGAGTRFVLHRGNAALLLGPRGGRAGAGEADSSTGHSESSARATSDHPPLLLEFA